jgi:hypothetical protein
MSRETKVWKEYKLAYKTYSIQYKDLECKIIISGQGNIMGSKQYMNTQFFKTVKII